VTARTRQRQRPRSSGQPCRGVRRRTTAACPHEDGLLEPCRHPVPTASPCQCRAASLEFLAEFLPVVAARRHRASCPVADKVSQSQRVWAIGLVGLNKLGHCVAWWRWRPERGSAAGRCRGLGRGCRGGFRRHGRGGAAGAVEPMLERGVRAGSRPRRARPCGPRWPRCLVPWSGGVGDQAGRSCSRGLAGRWQFLGPPSALPMAPPPARGG